MCDTHLTDLTTAAAALWLGVNLSGAEFGAVTPENPGRHGEDYVYPAAAYVGDRYTEAAELVAQGVTMFRLPFRWERLQPELAGPLDADELARLAHTAGMLRGLGVRLVLDPHNYGRYQGAVINGGGPGAPDSAAFANFWRRLANAFTADAGVIFGLMNEPHGMTHAQWVPAAQAAIDAIRAAGAGNMIAVPGIDWSGAHSWVSSGNGAAMLSLTDPLNNMVFEAHQYFDRDSSGTDADCVSPAETVARTAVFTNWLRAYGRKGFIGEFGGGPGADCDAALDAFADHVAASADVYVGWALWGAGPWWPADYALKADMARVRRLVR